jgi:peptidoglycan/LPS O-acetylase OafA/YrhL
MQASGPNCTKTTYRIDIDVLRALSVVAVVAFHLAPSVFPLGYLGVDCFFVISGYLVSRIIFTEIKSDQFNFGQFYRRRIRRLQPAIVFLFICLLAFVIFAPLPYKIVDGTLKHLLFAILFISNIRSESVASNYWGGDAGNVPLLHTWSLSIEEQFYIVLPTLFFVVAKTRWRTKPLEILAFMTGLSILWFAYLVMTNQSYYYSFSCRFSQLGIGSVLGFMSLSKSAPRLPSWTIYFAWLSLPIVILGNFQFSTADNAQLVMLLVVTALSCAIVISSGSIDKFTIRLWRSWPASILAILGKASYSIYLWHWPLIVFGNLYCKVINPSLVVLVCSIVAIICTTTSFFLVERLGRGLRRPLTFFVCSTFALGFTSFAGTRYIKPDISNVTAQTNWHGHYFDIVPQSPPPAYWAGITVHRRLGAPAPLVEGLRTRMHQPVGAILLGDSHACMWAKFLDEQMDEKGLGLISFASNGLGLFEKLHKGMTDGQVSQMRKKVLIALDKHRPTYLIIGSYWGNYSRFQNVDILSELIGEIKHVSPTTKIMLIGNTPVLDIGNIQLPDFLSFAARVGVTNPSLLARFDSNHEHGQRLVRRLCEDRQVLFLEIGSDMPSRFKVVHSGLGLYIDDDHLSTEGTRLFGTELARALSVQK